MRDFGGAWGVAGGWAVDLYLGRVTRAHRDLEIAVLRRDQAAVQHHLRGWSLEYVVPGERRPSSRVPWPAGLLLELPVHEIHGRSREGRSLEILLNESREEDWIYRRDARIAAPLDRVFRTNDGMPFLAPEVVLLFKSKNPRPIDHDDFSALLPTISPDAGRWLLDALSRLDPEHEWIEALRSRCTVAE